MNSRLTSFASLVAVVLSTLVIGCADGGAPEANVLDPGKKSNAPSGGGTDVKAKDGAPAKTETKS
jgi:hypothetical protein